MKTLSCCALLLAAQFSLLACASRTAVHHEGAESAPPPQLIGAFEDDYGIEHVISEQEWQQRPDTRYRVVRWHVDDQYLIAQNDADNPGDAGKWTRIDWMRLSDMLPYEWAFCLSAYAAASAEEAERTDVARRDTPKTGCNGYPYSRMRPRSSPMPVSP